MQDTPIADTGLSVFCRFEIDGVDLGTWTSISGLSVKFNNTTMREGGGGIFMHHLSGRFEYEPLTVRRPVGPYTGQTMLWLAKMASFSSSYTANIAALDTSGSVLFAWVLFGVRPTAWKGPSFDAANLKVLEEELTLAYTAFMVDVQAMGPLGAQYTAALTSGYAASGSTAFQNAEGAAGSAVAGAL